MIIRSYGLVELLATLWTLTVLVASSQNETQHESNNTLVASALTVHAEEGNSTVVEHSDEKKVKSERRAALFDTAESSPWVRVYNRPPGTNGDSFFNYETRGNTSAHTSGEGWDFYRTNSKDVVLPIDRREGKNKVQDILRVKPNLKENFVKVEPTQKKDVVAKGNLVDDTSAVTTNTPLQPPDSSNLGKNDTKGYVVWSNNAGGPSGGWTLDDVAVPKNKIQPSVDNLLPKDGTKWKVIGEGGDEGWQVVGDKGDVEWKIEYDDGEWKVTSTGDVPVDAEWVDPDYVWGPADGPLNEDDEYNSWAADDYAYTPWVDAGAYVRGVGNHSWPKNDYESPAKKISTATSNTVIKPRTSAKDQQAAEEPVKFGARRKTTEKDSSKAQERYDEQSDSVDDDKRNVAPESSRTDQNVIKTKSWNSVQPAGKGGQKWIQGYGSKTWEVDNTGWNSGFGGESWLTANKDFPGGPWVPKPTIGIQDVSSSAKIENDDTRNTENPIRGWGTGYGSKTWKGNEWDSNVVWKTGGGLPWTNENNTWIFPDQDNADDSNQGGEKTIVWSQPIPSEDDTLYPKSTKAPTKSGVRIKWPTRTSNIVKGWSTTPSRRTEEESWGDDSSEGGVVWKVPKTETNPTEDTTNSLTSSPEIDSSKGWETGEWNVNPQVEQQFVAPPWKDNAPPKTSNLISVKWKPDESAPNGPPPPPIWNQGQWFGGDPNNFPYWMFGGCKMAIKCGSTESDKSDDSSNQFIPPDSSYETSLAPTDAPPTTLAQAWPVKQFKGKSWGPPPKNWRPPPNKSWKSPPTKSWRPPKKSWKPPTSPPPLPTLPETPPPTLVWTEPTPPPTVSWPAPPPAPKQWKQRRPRPSKSWKPPPTKNWRPPATKSWKPPPTKSWKPPPPGKNWQPSIATPAPDMWTNPTPTKPDCKDVTEVSWPTAEPDTGDDGGPPQILIITKLPSGPKPGPPPATDKGDTKDDTKTKPPGKSWVFPPRKSNPKGGKNRRDKIGVNGNQWRVKPKKMSGPGNIYKGWPKGMPPPNFAWPGNNKRRWTTKNPMANWIPPKYIKSKSWRQMVKKWMSGRL